MAGDDGRETPEYGRLPLFRNFDETTGSFIPGTTTCAGSSIDMEILRDLFGIYVEVLQRWLGDLTGVYARGKILYPTRQGYEEIRKSVV